MSRLKNHSVELLSSMLYLNPNDVDVMTELINRGKRVPKCYLMAIDRLYQEISSHVIELGHKSEAYATESEMMNDFRYTYESLSKIEQEIFNML